MPVPAGDYRGERSETGSSASYAAQPFPQGPRVGVLSNRNLTSPWASTHYYAAQALSRAGAQVRQVAEETVRSVYGRGVLEGLSRRLQGGKPHQVSERIEKAVAEDLSGDRYDTVLAMHSSSMAEALEQTPAPVIYVTDATADLLQGYYPDWKDLPKDQLRVFHEGEHRAIERADRICVPSEWTAQSVIDRYRADPEKVSVVEWGANLTTMPEAPQYAKLDPKGPIELLFIGLDWKRKGGDIAVATTDELIAQGYDARLTMVGGEPPRELRRPHVTTVGRLNRAEPRQSARLDRLLQKAAFIIHPARAECYGHVLCESLAFGSPVIATDTGGISQCVTDGESGMLLAPGSAPKEYAAVIASLIEQPTRYVEMQRRAHHEFRTRLNWDRWASRVLDLVAEVRPAD